MSDLDEPVVPHDEDMQDDEGVASEEGEGDAVNPLSDDSSEEAPTDEEEANKIRADFIVDDDEDLDTEAEEDRKQQKRSKRRRIRKRRQSLDADDIDLLEENTGTRVDRARTKHLSRIRRGRASESASPPRATHASTSDDDSLVDPADLSRIFDDGRRGVGGAGDDMDLDDDDEGFIDDDDEDLDREMGEEEREQRRRDKRRGEQQRRKAMGARPELAGIDPNAWDEIFDVFGLGTEYDWALDHEDEPSDNEEAPKEMRYQDVFEPSEIAARYLTADDDVIRATDIPERMQLTTSSLSSSATLAPGSTFEAFPDEEIDHASEWVATRLSLRVRREFFLSEGKYHNYLPNLILAVRTALKYLLQDRLEVPYIWTHRRDHLSVFEPAVHSSRIELLSREELWRVGLLGARYRALHARKEALASTYVRMGVTDEYYEMDIVGMADSVDSVADAMEWLSMRYKQQHRDALELDENLNGEAQRRKKPSRISPYDVAKETIASRLADDFGISRTDVVRNVMLEQKHYFTDDHDLAPMVYAEDFVNESPGLSTPEEVLRTARFIVATELGKDPQLRKLTRERFKNGGLISVKPKEKGVNKIDEQHPYAAFKYLLHKPVENMLNDAQFLHILAAEADHLVTVSIELSPLDNTKLQGEISRAFTSDGFSDVASAWNSQRIQIVEEVVEKHLIPVGAKYIREWLREEVEETLANKCADVLERRVEGASFRPNDFEKGEVPAVLALSWGKGDPQKDPIIAVFVDEAGRLREHARFDNLMDPGYRSEFTELLSRRKPDVIVVGGFTILATKLMDRVREVVGYKDGQDQQVPPPAADNPWDAGPPTAGPSTSNANDKLVPLVWMPDQVARIYQHSKRAEEEFGSLPPLGRYCVGLARYAQSPVNEFAALGPDLVAITFHEDQHLLPSDKLLTALERTLVNVVNDIGVDINRAVTDSYYQLMLPFVSGLGPRKAQMVLKRIGNMGGTVLNREQFITGGIMTSQIFVNASGFLKIVQDPYDDSRGRRVVESIRQDPLDATRIHPEDYDLARKMATDALELDDEDIANQHPSAVVTQLMQDEGNGKKLDDLSLDDFALNLQQNNNERKRHTLDMIRDELLHPFGESRTELPPMSDWDVVTMLTGETRRTLQPGRVLTVTVGRVRSNQVDVRTDSGLDGYISKDHLTTDGADPGSLVKARQTIQAVILKVEVEHGGHVRIRLASRPDAIAQADEEIRGSRVDSHYDMAAARQAKELQQRKQRSEANRSRRVIKHPAFKNFNSKEAEAYLAPLQHGDAVIRPSSKGPDHLAVTWKVADGVYQHIDVVEPNADMGPSQASTQFIIDNQYYYVDLDDLLVNHVKAMSRKVDDLMAAEKYKGGSDQELHNFLTNFVKMNPTRSSYAFGLNRTRPGYFNLSFLANINSPIQTWLVKVTPTAYRLSDVEVGSVPDLCDAFKRKHQKDNKAGGIGKTPYGAGRVTPGRVPGVTPGYGTTYGKTPNPYQAKTPNAYGFPQPQPGYAAVPAPPAMPPPPVGMNPDRLRMIQQESGGMWGQTPQR